MGKEEKKEESTPNKPKPIIDGAGTLDNPISIQETEAEKKARESEPPRAPVLRRIHKALIQLLTAEEKKKALALIQEERERAREIKDLLEASQQMKRELPLGEFTPLATQMYEAGTSSERAGRQEEEEEGN